MILCKLHLENFKKYVSYSIEFGEGLIGIIGKNGSGKSTIFEAILFALYGELKNKGYKDILRNTNASTKDVVVVALDFEVDAIEFKVLREFRGKALAANAKLYKNGVLTTSGAKEVTAAIIGLTKMSKNAFLHTLFASQKELSSLSSLKNEDRKKMIRKLLGLEKIDFVEKLLVEKSRQLKNEISAFAEVLLGDEEVKEKRAQIKENTQVKIELEKEVTIKSKEQEATKVKELESKKELDVFVKTKEQKQKLRGELDLVKNNITLELQQQTKLLVELKDLEEKRDELKITVGIKKDYEALHVSLGEQEKLKNIQIKKEGLEKEQIHLRDQYIKAKSDIKMLEDECRDYDVLLAKYKECVERQNNITLELTQYQGLHVSLQNEISAEERVVSDNKQKITKLELLGRQSPCPICTRALLEEYDLVIASLHEMVQKAQEQKIDTAKVKRDALTLQIKEAEKQQLRVQHEANDCAKAISLIESKKKDLLRAQEYFIKVREQGRANKQELEKLVGNVYDEVLHVGIKKSLNELKAKYEYVLGLEIQLKRYDSITSDAVAIKKRLEALHVEYKNKETEEKNIHYDEGEHKKKQNDFDEIQSEKEKYYSDIGLLKEKIATLQGEIKTIQASLENNEQQLKKVQTKKDDLSEYEKIKTSLSDFKTKLNSKVAPRISDIASGMYAQITKGKYQHIEVSNDFDFYIYDEGKRYPIERFSGGEIDLANLVLRIAISKTLTELSGASSIGFLAFDEVFGSQDENRRTEILEAFHTIKEQYRQIFLISHEMEIKEMFERVIEL